ncbi:hypothetical protein H8B06_02800 [Sphingobacterium sp. DN00404]|uniref:Uncharacterized protein n=1 Tax=Sphingobacterium micropteri TaxID=2763501 RepID=A0ABR7YK88_9SPHI|nr:hypothetical protein [Sphingobacterium micropteri]MBD1431741.1 hypothetical protein [Sphingobacterium micropteri]
MNKINSVVLKAMRKVYGSVFEVSTLKKPACEKNPKEVSQILYESLVDDKPCMIARFGAFELSTVVNYLNIKEKPNSWEYIRGEKGQWWWDDNLLRYMHKNAGFFPIDKDSISRFCDLMINDSKDIDVLGSWLVNENYLDNFLPVNCQKVWRIFIDPFWTDFPWTRALAGKRVLVVHPFAEIIEQQYRFKRKELFRNEHILPDFELKLIKAVQSIGGNTSGFKNWFEALDFMKMQIENVEFDICLLGCGAYGFPLAAHVKRMGKKAVHWGGSLQLYFGIIGKRWENANYGTKEAKSYCPEINYPNLINEHWVRPESAKVPKADDIEGGCYW